MGEIKKRLPLKCPACDAPLREIHFGPAPNLSGWCYAAEHLMVWLLCRMLISHLYG